MRRSNLLVVAALLLAGVCLWYFSRLLATSAGPWWFLIPGLGFALAYVLGQAGLSARARERR